KDLKKYSDRIMLGTETFCNDAYRLYELAKENPGLIGELVWAGMDYVGEVGVGCWEQKDYAPDFNHGVGWVRAGSGREDLIGNETFCDYAYRFYELAKENPGLIGDFVWAGMDYLGEVGVGSWEYKDYAPDFNHGVGWVSAGSGRVDLIGNELAEAKYTKVAFE